MGGVPRGPGRWQASDGTWHPPEVHPGRHDVETTGGARRQRAPTWVGIAILCGGFVVGLLGLAVAFSFSLCSIGGPGSCSHDQNHATELGIGIVLVALFGAPGLAAGLTRQWWWAVIPLPLSLALVGYEIDHHDPINIRQALILATVGVVEVGTALAVAWVVRLRSPTVEA